jgi:aspartate aminotransferase
MVLSRRAQEIKPSATLAITAQAKKLQAKGVDIIGFGAGEPDFPTPSHIVDAAKGALLGGDTHYTPVGGTPELRNAVCHAVERDYGFRYDAAEVTVSCGAKHTLFNLFLAILDPGDEVVIPSPYWVSYPEQVQFAGGTPVMPRTLEERGFVLEPEALQGSLTARTKAVVLNSPSNPTGAMYTRRDLEALAAVLRDRDVLVVSDDIYHKLTYDGAPFASILDVAPDLRDRVVIVNGVSKTYAMTGWRIGYALGPKALIAAMENIQSQSTSNPTSFAQKGAAAALTDGQGCVDEMVREFSERRRILVDGLNAIPGIRCTVPRGAFYAFPRVSATYGARSPSGEVIGDSLSFASYLLEAARVAVVPGGPFGSEEHVRLSYATNLSSIREGVRRIAEALARLGRP